MENVTKMALADMKPLKRKGFYQAEKQRGTF